jgi:D-sedoheptulose 7-phosphate isomerase
VKTRAGSVRRGLEEGARLLTLTLETEEERIEAIADLFAKAATGRRTIFFCGNGGSAAEAQHLATELVARYLMDRAAIPAVALTTDTSLLTAVGNDTGFGQVFARQIEALGRRGDLLVAMTTSGRSPNVLAAVVAARRLGMTVIGMTGASGRSFARRCDLALVVPSRETPRVQEVHLVVGHLCCERAEQALRARPRRRRAGR